MSVERYMSKDVISIGLKSSIQDAISLMREHSIRHLPVVENGMFVGLVTQSDLRGVIIPSLYGEIDIKDVMVADPITVTSNASIEKAATLIYKNKIGALPVIDNRLLVGIITVTDILAAFIEMMGVLKTSARLDIILRDSPDSFEDVIRIIKQDGGEIISVGIAGGQDDRTYSFRLTKKNIGQMIKHLKQSGHEVVSSYT